MSPEADATQGRRGEKLGLSADQLKCIAQAVASAEQKTSAEIRVVVSGSPVLKQRFFPLIWAGAAALLLPWGVQFLWPMSGLAILEIQALIFMGVAGILLLPFFSERVVPRPLLKAAVRTMAIETFLAHGMVHTAGRSGVLIFVAAHEHMVEVVADEGIHNHLGADVWAEICSSVTHHAREGRLPDGLVKGVEFAGAKLSSVLPPQPSDVNELDDRVIIL